MKKNANLTIAMDLLRSEYDMERKISDSLDNKSGIFITAFGVLFTIWMQMLPIKELKEIIINSEELFIQIRLVSCMLIPILLGISTCIFFVMSLRARDFLSLNYHSVIIICKETDDTYSILDEVLTHFQEIIDHNSKVNDRKVKWFKRGVSVFIIFIILSMLIQWYLLMSI